jgi:hypothetical protein
MEEVQVDEVVMHNSANCSSSSLSSEQLAALVAAGAAVGVSPDAPTVALLNHSAFMAAVAEQLHISDAAAAAAVAQLEQDKQAVAAVAEAAAVVEAERLRQLEQRAADLAAQQQLAALQALRDAEELRQREQLAVQLALQSMGVCVAGFQWIKQPGGWRCAGGSHTISDSQVKAAMQCTRAN